MKMDEHVEILLHAFVADLENAKEKAEKLAAVRIFLDKLTTLYYLHALDTLILPKVEYIAAKRVVEAHEKREE